MYGVLLWEILTFAREQPFENLTDEKVIENIGHIYQDNKKHVSYGLGVCRLKFDGRVREGNRTEEGSDMERCLCEKLWEILRKFAEVAQKKVRN